MNRRRFFTRLGQAAAGAALAPAVASILPAPVSTTITIATRKLPTTVRVSPGLLALDEAYERALWESVKLSGPGFD